MPTTPILQLPYPAATDPADVPADILKLDQRLETLLGGTLSAAPPATPANGDLWAFPADAANGIVWMFRYNAASASAYKWEFVGGSPTTAYVATLETVPSTVAWVNLATAGPSLTLPRAGDYWLRFGARFLAATTAPDSPRVGVSDSGDTVPPTDIQGEVGRVSGGANIVGNELRVGRNAGDIPKLRYWGYAAGLQFSQRRLSVIPVRVS